MLEDVPSGVDPVFMHLTGTVVAWWGLIKGVLIHDLISLRKANPEFAAKEPFPEHSETVIEQWSSLQKGFFLHDGARLETISTLTNELQEAAEDRKIVVQYTWPYGGTTNSEKIALQFIKPRNGEPTVLECWKAEMTVEGLESLNSRLARLYRRLIIASMNFLAARNRPLWSPE